MVCFNNTHTLLDFSVWPLHVLPFNPIYAPRSDAWCKSLSPARAMSLLCVQCSVVRCCHSNAIIRTYIAREHITIIYTAQSNTPPARVYVLYMTYTAPWTQQQRVKWWRRWESSCAALWCVKRTDTPPSPWLCVHLNPALVANTQHIARKLQTLLPAQYFIGAFLSLWANYIRKIDMKYILALLSSFLKGYWTLGFSHTGWNMF
jgi:hypothetical protein